MDIYTAITRIIVESLAVASGTLSTLVTLPANATGPLDSNITLTDPGAQFVKDIAVAAIRAGNILCDMFEALF
jgi:hypothetical protein